MYLTYFAFGVKRRKRSAQRFQLEFKRSVFGCDKVLACGFGQSDFTRGSFVVDNVEQIAFLGRNDPVDDVCILRRFPSRFLILSVQSL